MTPEWQQKLPDFVKRLEEALYKNAPSKVCAFNTAIWVQYHSTFLPRTANVGFSIQSINN